MAAHGVADLELPAALRVAGDCGPTWPAAGAAPDVAIRLCGEPHEGGDNEGRRG